MLRRLADKRACTGCGACASVCPCDAISFVKDAGGFLYPSVDESKCVHCGQCTKACHVFHDNNRQRRAAYYGWHKDASIRGSSSSGGMFTGLAQAVLDLGGAVYGHTWDIPTLSLSCKRATGDDALTAMRQSKYIESDITCIYGQIGQDIKERPVLFCGTPCQCAALRQRFGENENLYLVSFVCHGVGAPALFREHYSQIAKGKTVTGIYMRDKSFGWHDLGIRMTFAGRHRDYVAHYSIDPYYYCLIGRNLFLRDVCYCCQYTEQHPSDVIIADYWGIKNGGEADDNKGVSMLLANSEQGERLIGMIQSAEIREMELSNCEYAFFPGTASDGEQVEDFIERNRAFLDLSAKSGFRAAAKQYMDRMWLRKGKVVLKKLARAVKRSSNR